MKSIARMFVLVMLVGMSGSSVYAEEAPKAAAAVDEKAAADQAMKEKMMKLTSPSQAHKALEPLAGKWSYASKFWMTPDAKPEETSGTAENAMIFGGRFLRQEAKGLWMGQPFEGLGYTGYDNIKEEYRSVWLDSMATGIMEVSGKYDASTKTLNQSGANSCPLTGEKARPGHSEWTITDNDHNSYTFYLAGPDGKEFKAMEILYTRLKE